MMTRVMVACAFVVACSKAAAPTPETKPETKPTTTPTHTDSGPKCDATRPPGHAGSDVTGCKSDAECTAGKNGRCNQRGGGHAMPMNQCEYDGCFRDDDCGAHGTCMCVGTGNYCVPGNCRTAVDCGGKACSPSNGCGFDPEGNYCHKADDECQTDDECRAKKPETNCQYRSEVGHWACVQLNCPVG